MNFISKIIFGLICTMGFFTQVMPLHWALTIPDANVINVFPIYVPQYHMMNEYNYNFTSNLELINNLELTNYL